MARASCGATGALGVAEVMDFPSVIAGDPDVLAKVALHPHVDGHAPGVTGAALDAYAAAGIRSDHEATTWEEALEKRRRGMWVLLREASNARNLRRRCSSSCAATGPSTARSARTTASPTCSSARGTSTRCAAQAVARRDRARGRAADGHAAPRPLPRARRARRDRARLPRRPRRARGPASRSARDGRRRGRRGRRARRRRAAVRRARRAGPGARHDARWRRSADGALDLGPAAAASASA